MKIGLLGGSFNPAHAGHLHISEIALKTLGLKQVWWLVSPQNPLKSKSDMADFSTRFKKAKAIAADNPHIKVLDIEMALGTRYTVDTLKRLQQKFPKTEFVWLMGADNLIQLPKWKKWEEILQLAEVHVFDRDEHFYKAVKELAYQKHPGRIHYHLIRKHPVSGTAIRRTKGLS